MNTEKMLERMVDSYRTHQKYVTNVLEVEFDHDRESVKFVDAFLKKEDCEYEQGQRADMIEMMRRTAVKQENVDLWSDSGVQLAACIGSLLGAVPGLVIGYELFDKYHSDPLSLVVCLSIMGTSALLGASVGSAMRSASIVNNVRYREQAVAGCANVVDLRL